jgi:hypothetical protein
MPKLYLLSMLLAFLPACSKDSNSNGATLQYKVNGELITMRGDYILFHKLNYGFTFYWLGADKPPNQWSFDIVSDSLHVGNYVNYVYDSAIVVGSWSDGTFMFHNGERSALHFSGDYININITQYANGYISGNFTAKLSPSMPFVRGVNPNLLFNEYRRGTTLITEGLFTNVPCIY